MVNENDVIKGEGYCDARITKDAASHWFILDQSKKKIVPHTKYKKILCSDKASVKLCPHFSKWLREATCYQIRSQEKRQRKKEWPGNQNLTRKTTKPIKISKERLRQAQLQHRKSRQSGGTVDVCTVAETDTDFEYFGNSSQAKKMKANLPLFLGWAVIPRQPCRQATEQRADCRAHWSWSPSVYGHCVSISDWWDHG